MSAATSRRSKPSQPPACLLIWFSREISMSRATVCSHQNQHTEGAGVRWCSDCGKKEPAPVNSAQETFAEKQEQANRIEGQSKAACIEHHTS
ncbi:hypothetical protein DENIT_70017 [Pseudomonas veronii]|nr:hypothetical protein DENIT_70017 [Pseudomonas veronii]